MKLSSQQALMLFEILGETLKIKGFPGLYTSEIRAQLFNDILRQQERIIKDLENDPA